MGSICERTVRAVEMQGIDGMHIGREAFHDKAAVARSGTVVRRKNSAGVDNP
jgi:hypothetical protein